MRFISAFFIAFLVHAMAASASPDVDFVDGSPEIDAVVEACLESEGVSLLTEFDTICYNSAIFPEQFLQLNDFDPAKQIVITSPGGNVATARLMSRILDTRGEPAIIAGQCMSACAMVILPGLDSVYIHRSAHIAVHGITIMDYRRWWGWLKGGAEPAPMNLMMAQLGYDFGFILHNSGLEHMEEHLEGQDVDFEYIASISDEMLIAAEAYECRVDPKDYWGMLDADHLRTFLSDRIRGMEAFAQNWEDPNNTVYKDVTVPISSKTYIFEKDHEDAGCEGA
ncbi:MAG: hypothetical protein QNI84_12225 [Henriciella sp.]|nr:hypothetical protein [Henriciella sp.]